MANQIGIPRYRDLLNTQKLADMSNNVRSLVVRFNMLSSENAIANRENETFDVYMNQYVDDMQNIDMIRQYAQNLVDLCNKANFIISKRSIEKHVYNWDDEDDAESNM